MIEKIKILQHGKGSHFGSHPSEEAFWLLCIVAYHHEVVVQLRKDRLDSLSEALVCPRRLSPVLLVKPIRHFKSDVCCLKEILLYRSAQVSLVSENHAVMVLPLNIFEIVQVMYVGGGHIIGMYNATHTTQGMEFKGIKIWNIAGGKPIHTLFGFRRSLRLSKYPYTAQGEESIEMIYENAYDDVMYEDSDIGKFHSWDEEEKLIEEFCPNIFCHPSISNDGKRVVSLADDYFIRVWDVKTEKLLIMFDGPDFSYAHFSPDGNYIVATSEHSISIHDSFTGVLIRKFDDDTLHFRKATFSPDGQHVAAGTTEGAIYIWDFPSLQELINENRERFKENPLMPEERRRYYLD